MIWGQIDTKLLYYVETDFNGQPHGILTYTHTHTHTHTSITTGRQQNFGLNFIKFSAMYEQLAHRTRLLGYNVHSNLLKMGQPTSNLAVETITVLCV